MYVYSTDDSNFGFYYWGQFKSHRRPLLSSAGHLRLPHCVPGMGTQPLNKRHVEASSQAKGRTGLSERLNAPTKPPKIQTIHFHPKTAIDQMCQTPAVSKQMIAVNQQARILNTDL